MADSTLFLIDGSGYIFRAYYAIRPLSTRDGIPTNAVLGFARMLLKLIREHKPTFLGIAFDPKENLRRDMYAEYKANREAPPEDLIPQFPLIHELVDALDIPLLLQPGYEADDVIAAMAKQAREHEHDVVVVSADKDLMQLVAGPVRMYDPMKDKWYDREAVIERFAVPPERVVDVLALCGDSSDNIPGVPKVGAKSAAKLVNDYGDVESIITALQEAQHGGQKLKAYEQSVLDHQADARLSKRLASLMDDAPVSFDLDKLRYTSPQAEKIGPFFRKIEAYALLREFNLSTQTPVFEAPGEPAPASKAPSEEVALAEAHPVPTPSVSPTPTLDPVDRSVYETITTTEALSKFVKTIVQQQAVCIDLKATSSEPSRAAIVGIALCVPSHAAVYIPVGHRYLGAPSQLPLGQVIDALKPLLEDASIRKMGHDLKFDYVVLSRYGITMRGIADDAMLAAYVLDPTRASYTIDALTREILGHDNVTYKDLTGSGQKQIPFEEVPVEQAATYAAEDADVAARLCIELNKRLAPAGVEPLYRDVELKLLPVLSDMEKAGVLVDIDRLRTLAHEFGRRLHAIEERAQQEIGGPINLASPKQLATLFYEKLGYPVVKKTKTGYSTDQEVLETLAATYELPRIILEHRLLAKLKSTYIDALPRMLNPETKRVHTSFNQTGAATGRLSSSDPNLQNIPIRTDDSRRIREAFIAPPDWVLISADYSQIELRLLAHLSGDENFIDAFRRGEDIHLRTAREVLGAGSEPDPESRRRAKAINFGILYGLSEFGLSKQLDISRAESRDYITKYFARYPSVRAFLDASIELGRENGFVSTLMGRRRYVPELRSQNAVIRKGAERIAMNTPIQGSAADLIKLAMIRVHSALKQHGFKARLLLQVHDELVLEAPLSEKGDIMALVEKEMSQVMQLAVPLVVDVGSGTNWAVAH